MAGKQNLYEKQLQRIVDSMGADLLEKMTPEERMQGLTISERVQGLTISERVQGLTISERVQGLTISQRLAGLSIEDLHALAPEVKAALLQLLDQPDETQH